jgi:hypothetical protein
MRLNQTPTTVVSANESLSLLQYAFLSEKFARKIVRNCGGETIILNPIFQSYCDIGVDALKRHQRQIILLSNFSITLRLRLNS